MDEVELGDVMEDGLEPLPGLADILPPLASVDYERLKADIATRGVQVPILVGEEGIIDGVNRWRITRELGLPDPPLQRSDARGKEALMLGLALNLARRHLTPEQKREVIASLRTHGWTQEEVARSLGMSRRGVDHAEGSIVSTDNASLPDLRLKVPRDTRKEIAVRVRAGESHAQVAADYGITRRRVGQIARIDRPVPLLNEKAMGVTLYWDDALEHIPRLKDGSVALVVADPPYNISESSWDQFPSPEEYLGWTERWLEALRPKLAPEYHLFVFCAPSYMARFEGLLLHQGWPLRSRVIWAYRNLSMGRDVADRFISSWQPIFHCGNHHLNWSPEWGEERLDVQIHASPQSNFHDRKQHPTAKPLKLIELFVRIGSKPGDVVLDPFAGGGVTGEACALVKHRSCVLIEKEEVFVATIERRLAIRRSQEGSNG